MVTSATARLAMKMLVTVCILTFLKMTKMTRALPSTARREMVPYRMDSRQIIPTGSSKFTESVTLAVELVDPFLAPVSIMMTCSAKLSPLPLAMVAVVVVVVDVVGVVRVIADGLNLLVVTTAELVFNGS